jgi:hypothetical protein
MSEEFATIAQTNNILGSSIGGGGGGSEFVAKIQAISGGARENLLTSYSSMEFIPLSKVQKSINNMQVLNDFLSTTNVYCRIGVVTNPNDERIPFVYAGSDFKHITFGVVVNGKMVTAPVSLDGPTGYWYNIATSALSGNYLFCCSGSSPDADTQFRIYKLNTYDNTLTAIAAYTGSNFKYPRTFSYVEKIDSYHYAYFDVGGTYRSVARLYVNEANDSCSYTKGKDIDPTMYSQVLTREDTGWYSTWHTNENGQNFITISDTWDWHTSWRQTYPIPSGEAITGFFVRCLIYGSNKCISMSISNQKSSPYLLDINTHSKVKEFGVVGTLPELINYKGDIWWTELIRSGNTYKKLT